MMIKRIVTNELLEAYEIHLYEEEKAVATIKKYICDLKKLQNYTQGREIDKRMMVEYKKYLLEDEKYRESSANTFLVAANCFFQFMGWQDISVKLFKIQKEIFSPIEKYLTKAEYKRLVRTAMEQKKIRLGMILQTICATGLRISELKYVTVESVKNGCISVRNKGKSRKALLPRKLQFQLKRYIDRKHIENGLVFVTSGGHAVDRSNIWREMKEICKLADVDDRKVFPHNLRHLFAQCFYALEKDIAKLADILGHQSIETTRIYIKSTGEEHLKQLERMKLIL